MIPQEILDSLNAVKGVFASAKGTKGIQLKQDVNRIEQYLLSQTQNPIAELSSRNTVSIAETIEEIANEIETNIQNETLFQFITESLQRNLHADRVVIYQFLNSEKAIAIAESRKSSYVSLLSQTLPYNSFGLEFLQNKLSIIPSVWELIPSQLQFWSNFQVSSGLLMPLIGEKELWGIIKIHYCREKKAITTEYKNLLKQVGMMLTIALKDQSSIVSLSKENQSLDSQNIPSSEASLNPEINDKINLGISNCQEVFKKLIDIQQNNAISLQNVDRLTTEYQESEQLITPIKTLKESLEILSVNTAIQATQQDSEEELISIAQQVETIASQAREAEIDIENWLQELRDLINTLARTIKPVETNFNTVFESIEQTKRQLEEIVEVSN